MQVSRGSATSRGYDSQWQKVRLKVLDRDRWMCTLCGKWLEGSDATVDHIIPLAVAPDRRLDEDNLRAACRACNSSRRSNPR